MILLRLPSEVVVAVSEALPGVPDPSGVRLRLFTIPRLVVVALLQESAFCAGMLTAGRSHFSAGGHVKRMQKSEGRMLKRRLKAEF
jgi:hypothetical protein